jgi:ADP-ribose pyrophosphatase
MKKSDSFMDSIEKTKKSNQVYSGKIINVFKDIVILPDGSESSREYIQFPQSVAILAITSDSNVILEKQYRYSIKQWINEIPAGKVDRNEDILIAAQRELAEETGYQSGTWTAIYSYYTSPGVLTEKQTLFLAQDLTKGTAQPELGENIIIETIAINEIEALLKSGKICDGKTLLALNFYLNQL